MNNKLFLENFWATEQKNELFVCMPFDERFDPKFKIIEEVAAELGFDKAKRTKENIIASDMIHEILDGIANSRTLLFDLSDDPKTFNHESEVQRINGNVLYELGIATAIRESEDVLIIREKTKLKDTKYPFDILHTRINQYSNGNLDKNWLSIRLRGIIHSQDWSKSRRVDAVAKSIDSVGFEELILRIYVPRTLGADNFFDKEIHDDPKIKLAILRFLDLGILSFSTAIKPRENNSILYEYSYYWTPFGREVIKHMGITKQPGSTMVS